MVFGLVDSYSAGIDPPKNGGISNDPSPVKLIASGTYASTSGTFVAPQPGRYQFVLQGAGASGFGGAQGGPGGLAARTLRLAKGQSVAYAISSASSGTGTASTSTVTFVDRTMTVTAGGLGDGTDPDHPILGVGGVATGGDININGVAGASEAASLGAFSGGPRGDGTLHQPGMTPGGPGLGIPDDDCAISGAGRLIVTFLGP